MLDVLRVKHYFVRTIDHFYAQMDKTTVDSDKILRMWDVLKWVKHYFVQLIFFYT